MSNFTPDMEDDFESFMYDMGGNPKTADDTLTRILAQQSVEDGAAKRLALRQNRLLRRSFSEYLADYKEHLAECDNDPIEAFERIEDVLDYQCFDMQERKIADWIIGYQTDNGDYFTTYAPVFQFYIQHESGGVYSVGMLDVLQMYRFYRLFPENGKTFIDVLKVVLEYEEYEYSVQTEVGVQTMHIRVSDR